MHPTLLDCKTCGYNEKSPEAVCRGELLTKALEKAITDRSQQAGAPPLPKLRRFAYLMACQRHCAVQLRSSDKMGYTFGDFSPDALAVDTLLDFVDKYSRSVDGIVPFRDWPERIKGKFISRIPVLTD